MTASLEHEYLKSKSLPGTLTEAHRTIAELTAELEALHQGARRDDLNPEILNRTGIIETIEKKIEQNKPFGTFIIDLNKFKSFNDKYGHIAGDQLLTELGDELYSAFTRQTDTIGMTSDEVGRFGGDEFFILVDFDSKGERRTIDPDQQMGNIYDRLKEVEQHFINDNPKLKSVGGGFAIGGTYYDPERPVDRQTLMEQADQKMYEHKTRNRRGLGGLASRLVLRPRQNDRR